VTLHRTDGRHALPRSSESRLDVGGQEVEIDVVEVVGIERTSAFDAAAWTTNAETLSCDAAAARSCSALSAWG